MKAIIPIPTPETVLPLLKEALADHRLFEYRMTEKGRKMAVDTTSVNMLIQVIEALNERNRKFLLNLAPNVGRMCLIAWEANRPLERI